jgi:hypothetical protein
MKFEEMTRNIPEKPIRIAMVVNEISKQLLDSNSLGIYKRILEFLSSE